MKDWNLGEGLRNVYFSSWSCKILEWRMRRLITFRTWEKQHQEKQLGYRRQRDVAKMGENEEQE